MSAPEIYVTALSVLLAGPVMCLEIGTGWGGGGKGNVRTMIIS